MRELYADWLERARAASSYRAMFALAAAITFEEAAPSKLRHAARRVTRSLDAVIEQPIANAAVLKRARERFSHLSATILAEAKKLDNSTTLVSSLEPTNGPSRNACSPSMAILASVGPSGSSLAQG